jgi:hypothetical protein
VLHPDGQSFWLLVVPDERSWVPAGPGPRPSDVPGLFNEAWLCERTAGRSPPGEGAWWRTDYRFEWDVDSVRAASAWQEPGDCPRPHVHHFGGMFRAPFFIVQQVTDRNHGQLRMREILRRMIHAVTVVHA